MQRLLPCMIFSVLLVISVSGQAQETPKLEGVSVKAAVDLKDGIYSYTYSLSNGATSTGQIWTWTLDLEQPQGGLVLSVERLVNGPGYHQETSRLNLTDPAVPKMVPAGHFSPPNWGGGLTAQGQASWGSDDAEFRILPGHSLSGFKLMSHGLPGLRKFRIDPKFLLQVDESTIKTEEDIEKTLERQSQIQDEIAVFGITIGPTAPPAQFVALDFVSYIIDFKHQASALGWITNKGVENSLDVKLDQVKKKLEVGDTKTASNVLKAFINEVSAQGCPKYEGCPSGKHLLPEAWALLKFNAEYLLGKL